MPKMTNTNHRASDSSLMGHRTMSFSLRQPDTADYVALTSWIPDAKACARWAGPRLGFPFTAADLPGLLSDVGGYSYSLIDGDGGILGFGQHWAPKPGAVHLGRIILSPAQRGKGHGRHLCQLLINRAVEVTQASTVTLRVYRDNAVAIALYTSLGFSEQQEESTQELLFMRLTSL